MPKFQEYGFAPTFDTNDLLIITRIDSNGNPTTTYKLTRDALVAALHNSNAFIANTGNTPSIQSGTSAERPVASTLGRVYLETDTQQILRDNGTGWDIIASHV